MRCIGVAHDTGLGLHSDPAYILALAQASLTLDDAYALAMVEIDGDEAVVRAAFNA